MAKEKKFKQFYKLGKVLNVWQKIFTISIFLLFIVVMINFFIKGMKQVCLVISTFVFLECVIGAFFSGRLERKIYDNEDEVILKEQDTVLKELDEMIKEIKSDEDKLFQEDVLIGHLRNYYFVLFSDFLELRKKIAVQSGRDVYYDTIESFMDKQAMIKEELINIFEVNGAALILIKTFYNTIDRKCEKLFNI